MKKNIIVPLIIGIIIGCLLFIGWNFVRGQNDLTSDEILAGWSGPVRDVIGTRVGTTTAPLGLYPLDNYAANVATSSSAVLKLLQDTDLILFSLAQPAASTTNFFNYDILASNDGSCDTLATTTAGDNYVATEPLVVDINWFKIDPANVNTNKGYENITAYATGTSFILTNNNWSCLQVEYSGASTTIWMQIREKVLQ